MYINVYPVAITSVGSEPINAMLEIMLEIMQSEYVWPKEPVMSSININVHSSHLLIISFTHSHSPIYTQKVHKY